MIKLHNADCLEAMRLMDDDSFELAIVDPPYGIGMDGGKIGKNHFKKKDWDNTTPSLEYFTELFRVSKNQIIWGANHFTKYIPPSRGWVYWDKLTNKKGHMFGKTFSSGELAYTSFDFILSHFEYKWQGNYVGYPNEITTRSKRVEDIKIHPTQKPVALYEWLLEKYAKKGDRILDTHLGSGSIAIACHNLGYDLTGYELDKDYYAAACKRLENHQKQLRMF